MGSENYSTLVRIISTYNNETGLWALTSDEVPGLFFAGKNESELHNDVVGAIKKLYKYNYDMNVDVKALVEQDTFTRKTPIPKIEQLTVHEVAA